MNKKDGKKVLEAINLTTKDYSPSKKIDLNIDEKIDLKELVSRNDKYGKYGVVCNFKNYSLCIFFNSQCNKRS